MTIYWSGPESAETYQQRNRWLVEALRSGEYIQGQRTLEQTRDGVTKVCCLGVACRVAMAHGVPLTAVETTDGSNVTGNPCGTMLTRFEITNEYGDLETGRDVPPYMVAKWFGWHDTNPQLYLDSPHFSVSAATRNDGGEPFEKIADAFEYTYLRDVDSDPTPIAQ